MRYKSTVNTEEKPQIVLEEVLNEETDRMVWSWYVPSMNLGGYCATKEDALSDARLCIGMQCPKIESLCSHPRQMARGRESRLGAHSCRGGCWCVVSEYWDDGAWQWAGSLGMCTGYANPLDPFQNDYVIDLMASALAQIPQQGEH